MWVAAMRDLKINRLPVAESSRSGLGGVTLLEHSCDGKHWSPVPLFDSGFPPSASHQPHQTAEEPRVQTQREVADA